MEYYPNATINEVDSANRAISTSIGHFAAEVLNVIPDQQAGKLARAGDRRRPLGADQSTQLRIDRCRRHSHHRSLPGDWPAQIGPHGQLAREVCADAIRRSFAGAEPSPAPMTNSACFSPLSLTTASYLTAVFRYGPSLRAMRLVKESFGASDGLSSVNYKDMFTWSETLFGDTFG